MQTQITDAHLLEFSHTDFNQLMQRRIFRVLLVCSNYDYYMLEEDGRIDEQIFNEYIALSIRFPPVVIQADTAKKAFEILDNDDIDLVILMLNIGEIEPFDLAHLIKNKYPKIPIVVLTHFSREVSIRLHNEDLSAIDHIFCWLGNADLLVAIIKLIEDSLNAAHDILQVGVQAILLVEDSVRYISQILPNLYKIIIWQSNEFAQEGLNEHEKMLRLRGRPKILLAKTFDEAQSIYQKYGDHILGIISDVSFKKSKYKQVETQEGFELCKLVRKDDPFLPFLFQSSDKDNLLKAKELQAGFVHKLSKSLSYDLKDYVSQNFGFGSLIFRDPKTFKEVAKASDLSDLQHIILNIPDKTFAYHARRNEISKWLNARALFGIGRIFRTLKIEDFKDINEVRAFIFDAIASYKMSKGRGVIASFDKRSFDEYLTFSRIGNGSLGGKGRGLAFVDSIIKKYNLAHKFQNTTIAIPRTVVVSTDLFDEFIEVNNLYKTSLAEMPDESILEQFLKAPLPSRLMNDLRHFVEGIANPIAVRSSSKLEDSHYQPFAGVYKTYMVPYDTSDVEKNLEIVAEAIKCVYASVFYKESKAYIMATSNSIDEEKMGIILEEVCGKSYQNRYYPSISGVARSVNYYPIAPETVEDGVATIVYGLGKYVVDGGVGLRFSPKFPKKILQLSTPQMAIRETQKYFYALDANPNTWRPNVDDKKNILTCKIDDAKNDNPFKYAVSTYDIQNQSITDNPIEGGMNLVTFSKLLNYNLLPLSEILQNLLNVGQQEMNNPIEIEFAVDMDVEPGNPFLFYVLQIRSVVETNQNINVSIDKIDFSKTVFYSASTLGNGMYTSIKHVVYVKNESFKPSATDKIADELESINNQMKEKNANYILAGPGRWGSIDPWLGIPVKWAQISEASIIIEAGQESYQVDPSQGTHFFQNLTSFGVGYMTINAHLNEGIYNTEILNKQDVEIETEYLKVVKFNDELVCMIDGKTNRGMIVLS
jgi:CheY-like chemotaxis protein